MNQYEEQLKFYLQEQKDLLNHLQGILPESSIHFQRIVKRIQLLELELKEAPFQKEHFNEKKFNIQDSRVYMLETSSSTERELKESKISLINESKVEDEVKLGEIDRKLHEQASLKKQELEVAINFCRENGLNERCNNLIMKRDKIIECIDNIEKGSKFAGVKIEELYLTPEDMTGMNESTRQKSNL